MAFQNVLRGRWGLVRHVVLNTSRNNFSSASASARSTERVISTSCWQRHQHQPGTGSTVDAPLHPLLPQPLPHLVSSSRRLASSSQSHTSAGTTGGSSAPSAAVATEHVNEAILFDKESVEGEGPWMSGLRKRGLYSEARYGHYHKYTVDNFAISDDKKKLTINWTDGHTSRFDTIWLRHTCHCGVCKHDTNGMGTIQWSDLPLDISLLSVEQEGDRMMVLRWGTPDGKELHHGAIPIATLRLYCYSDKAIKERRTNRAINFYHDKDIPEIEYEEVKASGEGLQKWISIVNQRGICVLKNVPTEFETFTKTVELLGPIQNTMYGATFEVFSAPNPVNAAYSSHELGLHMDLPFYETSPGIQILHCWRFDKETVGGKNTFVDIHKIAHQFREEQPEFFDRLARLPVTFNSIHYNRKIPVHMENQKPIFSLNHLGELVSVTWHPMVQGPTELPEEDMLPFYEAYTAFYKMIADWEPKYRFLFTEGDFVSFNNRRILHGRDAFQSDVHMSRYLAGAYVELSDFHSRSQALNNVYGGGKISSRSGSHSWF